MTRGSRPQLEVCHKLTLLPCAKEIVENAAKSVLIRVFDPTTDHLGRAIQRELHILRGCHIQSFRADMQVEVVLDVTRLVERGEPIAVRFYSVYEKR